MNSEIIVGYKKRIRLPKGLIPICSYCQKIRDDTGKEHGKGNWESIDAYMFEETDQEFTHGICPDCVKIAFPNINEKIKKNYNE